MKKVNLVNGFITKKEKDILNLIYEKVSDKRWKFGCKIKFKPNPIVPSGENIFNIIYAKPDGCSSSCYIEDSKVKSPGIVTADLGVGRLCYIEEYSKIPQTITPGIVEQHGISFNEFIEKYIETIGSDIMIGDVLQWIEKYDFKKTPVDNIVYYYRKDKSKPIQNQPNECIEYIYNLIYVH